MDEQRPKHTPGPYYYFEAVPDSHDVNILSGEGEIIARVMSQGSGHTRAPKDDVAMQNVALFIKAARMREALGVVLEREHEPMHPMVAGSVKDLIAEIDRGERNAITHQRKMNQERRERQSRTGAVAKQLGKSSSAEHTDGIEEDTEAGHSLGW